MKYVGVDGYPDGWLAVEYEGEGFQGANCLENIDHLWEEYNDAESVLIDVPIGLRENSNKPRPCDEAARKCLGWPRSRSVFPTPVRGVLSEDDYEDAKRIQEKKTDASLGAQTWGISNKISEIDDFLLETEPRATGWIREAHPEVCYWSLNDKQATFYSKTGTPVAAFWERVEILERVDEEILKDIRQAGTNLDSEASNDDLLDAFVLAITACPLTGDIYTLPRNKPEGDNGDPEGLPMEMAYSEPIRKKC